MIESRQQADLPGKEHAVAENIAAHVADADDGEGFPLDVPAHFPEMAFHALPGTAGGNTQNLVIVAAGAAAGEGVPQPETVLGADGVGRIGKVGRPLVGGDDQVRVVIVVGHDPWRTHHLVADPIVGQVEQAAHQRPVGCFGQGGAFLAAAVGGLDHESPLGADGNNQGILGHLGLHQPQDLGAEIVWTVRPADPAPGHLAAAQVNPLHAGRMHVDLEQGPWRRHIDDADGADFEGEVIVVLVPTQEKIGPDRGVDQVEENPQDAIFVDVGDRIQRFDQLLTDRRQGLLFTPQGVLPARLGTEAALEIAIEQ